MGSEKNPEYFISKGHILSWNFEISHGFNNFFSDLTCITFIFAEEIILVNLKKIKKKNSAGPYNISSRLLKEIIGILLKPLVHVFNLSFKSGEKLQTPQ